MAYNRYVTSIKVNGTSYPIAQVSDFSTIYNNHAPATGYQYLPNTGGLVTPSGMGDLGTPLQNILGYQAGQETSVTLNDYNLALLTRRYNVGNNNVDEFIMYDQISEPYSTLLNCGALISTEPNIRYYFCIMLDDEQQFGCILTVYHQYDYNQTKGYYFGSTKIYDVFKEEATQYTWQSVPSISGKNGILSLVTLDSESINDGEPVSGAAVSVFDQAPSNGNNIKNLADIYGGGEESSAVDVTVKYKVTLPPGGVFDVLKLVAKKGSEPEDATDGDKIVDISPSKTKKTVTGLDENSIYYFKIFAEDSNGSTSESNEKHITTSGDEGWLFNYTGEIQTFTAPKTGIYSLETWGAQGGNATDGTNVARGGYGAYAYGEVLLQQGDTLYINVGGQNGYGGGGVPPVVPPEYQAQIDQINGDSGSGYDFYWKSYTTWDGSHLVEAPFDNYSWSKKADESQDLIIDGRPFDTRYMYPNTKFDVYIDGEGSSYQLKLHDYQGREDGVNWSGSRAYKCYANTTQMVGATPSTSYSYDYFLNNYVYYTGTISGCLDYIIANFRNVNIYVNGVQWASV